MKTLLRPQLWICTLLLAGCGSLPDLDRGRQALKAGDDIAAEGDLRPLAEMGYREAQAKLAKIHFERNTPQDFEEAVHWYRQLVEDDRTLNTQLARALVKQGTPAGLKEGEMLLRNEEARGDPVALVALVELLTAHPELDPQRSAGALVKRAEALNSPELEATLVRWHRRNEPGAVPSPELVERCKRALDRVPDCYVDLVHAYRVAGNEAPLAALAAQAVERTAAGTLSPEIAQRVGWALVDDEMGGKPHPQAAHALLKVAAPNSMPGKVRLARLLIEYPQLDPAAKPEQMLEEAAAKGYPEAALALGRLYLGSNRVAPDPMRAEKYLRQAAEAQPSAHFHLGRLYKRGDLGRADLVGAARHYLSAARAGYERADFALAELFSESRGVKPNLANAYSFASIATANSVPEAAALQGQIRARMSPAQLAEAEALMRKEIEIRAAAGRAVAAQAASASTREGSR